MLKSYRDLLVWQRALEIAVRTYLVTNGFPKSEVYGLTSQLRCASVSIPSNIAEGYGRGSRKEYVHFLSVARGSLKELETQVILSGRLGFAAQKDADYLLGESEALGKMLTVLIRSLRKTQ